MAVLSVPIVLDKPRNLKYGFKAMEALETKYGDEIGFLELVNTIRTSPKMKMIGDLIWAGLIHEDPELTREDVSDILDASDLETLVGTISKATEAALKQKNAQAAATKKPKVAKSTAV
jgi:hypothetical protein